MENAKQEEIDLDEILKEIGQFGKFQRINYLMLSLPIFLAAFYCLAYVFTAGTVDNRCQIPECEDHDTTYITSWLKNAVPYETKFGESVPKSCTRFQPKKNYSEEEYIHKNSTCPSSLFLNKEIKCNSWVFKKGISTIASEWNIACDNTWKLTLVGTINNIGQFIGLPLAGFISDRVGRKFILITSTFTGGVIGIIKSFSTSYEMFIALEFIEPIFDAGIYQAVFILAMELVGPDKRVLGGSIISIYYCIGEAILGLIAWLLRDWRIFLRAIYAPAFICISFYWIVPESIRWLLIQKRTPEAIKILKTVAARNGKTFPEHLVKNQSLEYDEIVDKSKDIQTKSIVIYGKNEDQIDKKTVSETKGVEKTDSTMSTFHQVIKSRIILCRLLNCAFCWMTNTFVYYGLNLNSVSISANRYSNFILVSLVEFPAYIVTYMIMDKLGRKYSLSSALLLSGACCMGSGFIPQNIPALRLALFLIGKMSITSSFTVIYVYTTEMFPTVMRHSTLGVCSMIGRTGSIIATQTPALAMFMETLPVILFGIISFIAGVLALLFPETLNTKLPDTIKEAEQLSEY